MRFAPTCKEVGIIGFAVSPRGRVPCKTRLVPVHDDDHAIRQQHRVGHHPGAAHVLLDPASPKQIGRVGRIGQLDGNADGLAAGRDVEIAVCLDVLSSHDEDLRRVIALRLEHEHDSSSRVGVLCQVRGARADHGGRAARKGNLVTW